MEAANQFLNDFALGITKGMHVAKLAKVVRFDPNTMVIDALPLPSEDHAMVLNVPVATVRSGDYILYYPLKAGDMVVLLFMDNDTDNILLGEDSTETERGHDVSDCVCIGGITLLKDSLPVGEKDALVVQNMGGTGKIVLKKDGSIKLESPKIELVGYASYNGREIAVKGDKTSDGARIV